MRALIFLSPSKLVLICGLIIPISALVMYRDGNDEMKDTLVKAESYPIQLEMNLLDDLDAFGNLYQRHRAKRSKQNDAEEEKKEEKVGDKVEEKKEAKAEEKKEEKAEAKKEEKEEESEEERKPVNSGRTFDGFMPWQGKPTTEMCKKYDGQPRSCGYAGCSYNKWNHECYSKSGDKAADKASQKEKENKKYENVGDCLSFSGNKEECLEAGCVYDDDTSFCEFKEEKGGGGQGKKLDGDEMDCSEHNDAKEGCSAFPEKCTYNDLTNICSKRGGEKHKNFCKEVVGDKKTCEKAGCKYNSAKKQCLAMVLPDNDFTKTHIQVRAKRKHLSEKECLELSKSPRGCIFAGCLYDEDEKKCGEGPSTLVDVGEDGTGDNRLSAKECSVFADNPKACRNVGCKFKKNKCVQGADYSTPKDKSDIQSDPKDENNFYKLNENAKPRKITQEYCEGLNCNGKADVCLNAGCLFDKDEGKCYAPDTGEDFYYTFTYIQVKAKNKVLSDKQCGEMNASQKGCNYAGCKYVNGKKKCLKGKGPKAKKTALDQKECSVFNGKPRPCGYSGCQLMVGSNKCVVISPGLLEPGKQYKAKLSEDQCKLLDLHPIICKKFGGCKWNGKSHKCVVDDADHGAKKKKKN